MRRLFGILSLILVVGYGTALWADSYTSNYRLTKPSRGSANWDTKINTNMDTIDGLFFEALSDTDGFNSGIRYADPDAVDHSDENALSTIAYHLVSIGADNEVIGLRSNTEFTLTNNLSIPANVKVIFQNGAMLKHSSGKAVTFDNPGQIEAGRYQIFTGDGSVVFTNPGKVSPDWWGADPTGVADSGTAITAACASLPEKDDKFIYWDANTGIVELSSGEYRLDTPVVCRKNGLTFKGQSVASTRIRATEAVNGQAALQFSRLTQADDYYVQGVNEREGMWSWLRVGGFQLMVEAADAGGIYVGPGEDIWIDDVWLQNDNGSATSDAYGIWFDGSGHGGTWMSLARVKDARFGGWYYGIKSDGGVESITNVLIETCDYGIYAADPDSGDIAPGSIGTVRDSYIQDCGIGIFNEGRNGLVLNVTFEANETYDYTDNGTAQAHNTLIGNHWTVSEETGWLPTLVSVNSVSTVLDQWLPNQLGGMRNVGILDLIAGTSVRGSALRMFTGDDKTAHGAKIMELRSFRGNGTSENEFEQVVGDTITELNMSSEAKAVNIGTTLHGNYPVNIYTGNQLRGKFTGAEIALYPSYGSETNRLGLKALGADDEDPWGLTASDFLSEWGPVHTLASQTNGLRIGPLGVSTEHPLWYTAIVGYRSGGWYAPLIVDGKGVHINSDNVPDNATSECKTGQIAWDDNGTAGHLNVCVDTNTWRRAKLETW